MRINKYFKKWKNEIKTKTVRLTFDEIIRVITLHNVITSIASNQRTINLVIEYKRSD